MMLPWALKSSKNWSGCRDSNPGPPDPQSGALARLRYIPIVKKPAFARLCLRRQRGSARYALRRERGRDFARGRDAAGFRLAGLPRL